MSQKTKGYKLREESGQRNSKVMCPWVIRWLLLPCLSGYKWETVSLCKQLAPFLDAAREPRGAREVATFQDLDLECGAAVICSIIACIC